MAARGSAAVVILIALLIAGARPAHAVVAGTWHNAVEVPGSAALNKGGVAQVNSVSCPSAGNCAAGGSYSDSASNLQAFVASEVHGVWHTAVEVPGTAALNKGGLAQVNSVSCESAGNCVAGGSYSSALAVYQAFAASEVNGTWHTAAELPGSAALNRGANAQVDSVSCVSGSNCGAGGFYTDSQGNQQVFVASEVSGVWHNAIEVPGTAALHKSGVAWLYSVSCASAGNCGVGGSYGDAVGREQAYVVNEVNGTWGTAIEVPGTAALNTGAAAGVNAISCPSAGTCGAGGSYTDGSGGQQAFVANQS